jgi:hypothetical protein
LSAKTVQKDEIQKLLKPGVDQRGYVQYMISASVNRIGCSHLHLHMSVGVTALSLLVGRFYCACFNTFHLVYFETSAVLLFLESNEYEIPWTSKSHYLRSSSSSADMSRGLTASSA